VNNRIAVLVVGPCRGSIYEFNEVPNHHRYTLFERKAKTGKFDHLNRERVEEVSTALLRYESKTIEEFLSEIKVTFSVGRNLQARKNAITSDESRRFMYVSASVSGDDRVIAHPLGECEGYDCYAVYRQSDVEGRNALSSFHIKTVPDHGRATVVYMEDTLRDSFTRRNVTQTIQHEGNMPIENQLVLFDWMNERIKPIAAPMIALLPPPEDCR